MKVYSIESLHDAFQSGKVEPKDYYQQIYKEAQFQQKRLNAFAYTTFGKAEKDLKNADFQNILSGIPYVLKDNLCTQNIYTTASSRMLEDYIPTYNAHVVDLLERQGCCLIGKSSMDELGMGFTNMTALTGPVYNPWDVSRIAGGSSGGSAALVASGLIPFALGSDTGDSIRRPAGYCGVVGMKPTWGRVSRYGLIPYASSLDTIGALTRNVRDMAIVMENISGHDHRDMTSSFQSVPRYFHHLSLDISHLKIAFFKNIYDSLTDLQMKKIFDDMVVLLKQQGAKVDEIDFPERYLKSLVPVYNIIANGESTSNHACLDGIKYGMREDEKSIEDIVIQSRSRGFTKSTQQRFILGMLVLKEENQEKMFRKSQKVRRLIVEELNHIFQHYDLIISLNSDSIAPHIQDAMKKSSSLVDAQLLLANLAGLPSLTLPCGFVDDMPVAINLTGRLFEEQTVLNCAYALENVLPFKNQYVRGDHFEI